MITGQHVNYKDIAPWDLEVMPKFMSSINNVATRTTCAIAFLPTVNTQGGGNSLITERRLNRSHWTKLPMPAEVTARVNKMASQNFGTKEGLKFYDKTGPEEDEDQEHMGDDTRSPADEIPNNNPAANNIVQDTESETANEMVEDSIAEVIEDPTAIDDPQNDDGDILNAEDSETVDEDTNNANYENAEAKSDNAISEENFDECCGIRTSHYK